MCFCFGVFIFSSRKSKIIIDQICKAVPGVTTAVLEENYGRPDRNCYILSVSVWLWMALGYARGYPLRWYLFAIAGWML